MLLTGFSILALVLAWIGIYGLVQYSVTQRRREIGIRMALGADRAVIVGGVLNEGLRLAACGATIGLLGVGTLGRLVGGLLFNVSPIDPASVAGATAVLGLAAIIGCAPRSRRHIGRPSGRPAQRMMTSQQTNQSAAAHS